MASTSNISAHPQLEESAPPTSASAGSSVSTFVRYEPPTTELPFQRDKSYHVFLSFRGTDVRNTLVDHLYEALSTAGLIVFLDSEKIEKGEIIGLSLDKAIESSAICVPIFSKGYADSAWCLKEAAAMLRTSDLIIPLFYHVDPAHVRHPLHDHSPYKQSFLKHYRHSEIEWWKQALVQICPCLGFCCRSVRQPREVVDEWKHALREICSRSGWTMDITKDFEARLVKMVVKDLLNTFDRAPLEVAEHLVGLESVKNFLIQKLQLGSGSGGIGICEEFSHSEITKEVVKVGIWGIGGIGKTTVATALYNQVYNYFEAASFVFNVRATAAEATGLTTMQKQILEQLAKYDGEVYSVPRGKYLFRDRLGGKRVLLILDDVDDVVQLNALVGDWLAPGSRVIITSRDKHILNVAGVTSIHEMSGLELTESLQLFSWYAFAKEFPPSRRYEDLSIKIVKACKGHPLSLEVIGSFLSDKQDDIGCWTEALNISRIPDMQKRVYNTLKISYNALSDEEKEIFLDVVCLFTGENTHWPIVFWKSLYQIVDIAVRNLSMKLLIKIDNNGHFYMHDHLRDMGRTIAKKEKDCTLLWTAADLSTVPNNTNFSRLRLNGCNPQSLKMLCTTCLRYLHLENLVFEDLTEKTLAILPTSLIWLRLEGGATSRFVFSVFQSKVIQLEGFSWFGTFPISSLFSLPSLSKLVQHMDMALKDNYKLKSLPDTIGNVSNLQKLNLKGFGSLIILPDTIGNMSQLQHLDLGLCKRLEKLPDAIGNLSQLQHLDLGLCKKLEKLPDTIGKLSQLQHLDLGLCKKLEKLPDTIGNLSQLQYLDLGLCKRLEKLPDTIGNLSQLRHLHLEFCNRLENLPDIIGNLTQLQQLDLRDWFRLKNLPDTIGNLSQLQHLNLRGCFCLKNLPGTIGKMSQLQQLDLGFCKKLQNLPNTIGNLSQLQHLNLRGCFSLKNLPDTIGKMSQLQHLNLGFCNRLENLPDTIGNLSQLQHLDLRICVNLKNLPDSVGNLSQLKQFHLTECFSLNVLPDTIGNLTQLEHLDLERCYGLNILPDTIGKLSQLKKLDLTCCDKLINLPDDIGNLSQLLQLSLRGCNSLNKLPDTIGDLSQLQHLDLRGCNGLNNLPHTIGDLSQLQHLDMIRFDKLSNLPDTIGKLSQLQSLY